MLKATSTMAKTLTYQSVSRPRTELNTVNLFRTEHVTLATDGAQQLAGMAVIDLATQPLDVNLDQIGEDVEIFVPDVFSNLGAVYDLIRVPGKIFEQGILLAGELYSASRTAHATRLGINGHVGNSYGLCAQRRPTTQQRASASQQLVEIEWL